MSGNGTIRQRGDAWELRYQHAGKTRTQTFHGSKQKAKAKLRELLTRTDNNKVVLSRDTFGAWCEAWQAMQAPNVSPMTARLYEAQSRLYLLPALAHVRLRDIDRTALRLVYADLAGRLSPNSIATLHRVVSGCFACAVEAGKIDSNPAAGWRGRGLPKVPETERPILTVEDARRLLDIARAGPTTGPFAHQPWMLFPIIFALGCGMRRSEIAALTWDRINLETGEVLISESIRELSHLKRLRGPTKTGKVRRVYLPGWALAELKEPSGSRTVIPLRRGPVCLKPDGEPVNPNAMTEAFKHLAEQIGFVGTFHDLRHTAASWALAASASVKDVQLMLGHSKPSTTLNTYSHAMPDSASGTAAKLDAVMGG